MILLAGWTLLLWGIVQSIPSSSFLLNMVMVVVVVVASAVVIVIVIVIVVIIIIILIIIIIILIIIITYEGNPKLATAHRDIMVPSLFSETTSLIFQEPIV